MPVPDAYRPLLERLGLGPDVACDPDWSAAADFLELIADHVLHALPDTIVECSSGLSTLILARCCALAGRGRVYSLENGADYARNTRAEIARHGLESYATVLDAPLIEQSVHGVAYQWYALDGLPERAIDMLVIDGPPGFLQRHSRYPALPRLIDRLAVGCTLFMDDAARPDERDILALWQARYPGLHQDHVSNQRGCAIMSFTIEPTFEEAP
jgi:predicted O-methyltransferase YrrM